MSAKALMFQGTGSDVGKSLWVAALCRLLHRRGERVLPFKPQNMSNNAAVAHDGGEIGRAQALQAQACGVAPSVHMNPVLLKPQSEVGSQVVVHGKLRGRARAERYREWKKGLLKDVSHSFRKIKSEADWVIVEGAGSPAEVNLRAGDIANMGFALPHDVPVILVGDIDRGGVIASLVGTYELLPPEEQAQVLGFGINKFRGRVELFDEGLAIIERRTGWQRMGVLPHLPMVSKLPAEDGVALDNLATPREGGLQVAVLCLPSISNFDDLDPLLAEPDLSVRFLRNGEPLPPECRLVILPGSKVTLKDLAALRAWGWEADLLAHRRRGGAIWGFCGGFQMLGNEVCDPMGIEGDATNVRGLGLLDIRTEYGAEKTLRNQRALHRQSGEACEGYEIHLGHTSGADTARAPFLLSDGRPDGAASADGLVWGTYLHGVLASDGLRRQLLQQLGAQARVQSFRRQVDGALDELAQAFEQHLDIAGMLDCARLAFGPLYLHMGWPALHSPSNWQCITISGQPMPGGQKSHVSPHFLPLHTLFAVAHSLWAFSHSVILEKRLSQSAPSQLQPLSCSQPPPVQRTPSNALQPPMPFASSAAQLGLSGHMGALPWHLPITHSAV